MNKLALIVGGSTLIYAGLAFLMGVMPGIELSAVAAGAGVVPLTALEAQGRAVYVANGCSYCHTQQVRPLDEDKVFGRPSAPGDFKFQTPELLGSERTGPDLTNIGVRQPSSVWQYIHLYNPRAVVPESIMPSFSWLFEVVDEKPPRATQIPLPGSYAPARGVVVARPEAEALIAYLAALKQPAWSGAQADSGATEATSVHATGSPVVAPTADSLDSAQGARLYVANCSACHQANGEGLPGAFPPLHGDHVVNDDDASRHIQVILHGLQGTAVGGVLYGGVMPPFAATLKDAEIAAIANYERTAWGNKGKSVSAEQVAAQRQK
jgi:cytochrome c oxidase cbb3-type subunit 2